jgi:hypothetical protein
MSWTLMRTTEPQRLYAFAVGAELLASDDAGVAVATSTADISCSTNGGEAWRTVLVHGRPPR